MEKAQDVQCSICKKKHRQERLNDCPIIQNCRQIEDSPVPSYARQSLPPGLKMNDMADGTKSITVNSSSFDKGSVFGPVKAKKSRMLDVRINFPLKVFNCEEDGSDFYLDTYEEQFTNWMSIVNPATSRENQNLSAFQYGDCIYFIAIRRIDIGEELRVWYDDNLCLKMDKTPLPSEIVLPRQLKFKNQMESQSKQKRCRTFTTTAPKAKLLKEDQKQCDKCGFESSDLQLLAVHLQDHLHSDIYKAPRRISSKHVNGSQYPGEKNAVETVVTDSSGKKTVVKVPIHLTKTLILNTLDDNLPQKNVTRSNEKENEIKPCDEVVENYLSKPPLIEILNLDDLAEVEYQGYSFETDEIIDLTDEKEDPVCKESEPNINNNIDKENLKIEESRSHECRICSKTFKMPKYLYRHLTKHTGKYKCKNCLVVFSRKENLDSHQAKCSENSRSAASPQISVCKGREKNAYPQLCEACGAQMKCKREKMQHRKTHCMKQFKCMECGKTFSRQDVLRKHQNLHSTDTKECQICRKKFANQTNLDAHIKRVHEATEIFMCTVCDKVYKFKGNLMKHFKIHYNWIKCDLCGHKEISKSLLRKHKKIHAKENRWRCCICSSVWPEKLQLENHMKEAHNYKWKCKNCHLEFSTRAYLRNHRRVSHRRSEPLTNRETIKQQKTVENSQDEGGPKENIEDLDLVDVHSQMKTFDKEISDILNDWDD